MTLWHMGALHPFEQALTLVLAFGPFVLLGVVLWRRSKEDRREDAAETGGDPVASPTRGPGDRP